MKNCFICDFCDYGSTESRKDFEFHMKRRHNKNCYTCKQCNIWCSSREDLEEHKRQKHEVTNEEGSKVEEKSSETKEVENRVENVAENNEYTVKNLQPEETSTEDITTEETVEDISETTTEEMVEDIQDITTEEEEDIPDITTEETVEDISETTTEEIVENVVISGISSSFSVVISCISSTISS